MSTQLDPARSWETLPLEMAAPGAFPRRRRRHRALWAMVPLAVALVGLVRGGSSAPVVPGSVDPRGFRFIYVNADSHTPVGYNPCDPIHYVINPSLAPKGAVDDVHAAFAEVSTASGLKFVDDGFTNETPSFDRASFQPERYGRRWAPVLIAWEPGLPDVAGSVAAGKSIVGEAGSRMETNDDGQAMYVTGMAVFNADAPLQSGYGGETWGQVMLHELGHVVGLAHVPFQTSVMYPELALRPATFSTEDREGLWQLGLGGTCRRTPAIP